MNGRWRRVLVVTVVVVAALGAMALAGGPETPGQVGEFDSTRLAGVIEDLESFINSEFSKPETKVPGLAWVIVQTGQSVTEYSRALGVKVLGGEAVAVDTVFEIGSTSKAFTAAMLGMVVEDGKLSWDDRVVDHLPHFKMPDRWVTQEMRVADLVCQRSGLPEYSLDPMSTLGFSREQIIRAIRHVDPASSFRSTLGYQNNMWLVAAALIEKATGLTWEDNLDRRIFGPLEMGASTANPEVVAGMPNVATGHFYVKGGTPDDDLVQPIPADWPYRGWVDTYGPAGNIRSNVLDLAKWLRFHISLGMAGDTRIMQAWNVALLHAPRTLAVYPSGSKQSPTPAGDSTAYASGWLYQTMSHHPVVWHNGSTTGMHSVVGFIPEVGVGFAMLTNRASHNLPEQALMELVRLVFAQPAGAAIVPEAVLGTAGRPPVRRLDPVVAQGPALPLERYVGTYENRAYGAFVVRLREGQLELVMGPLQHVGVLHPLSGNTFSMEWTHWPGNSSEVTFTVPSGHPAARLTAQGFEDVDGGEFVRAGSGTGH